MEFFNTPLMVEPPLTDVYLELRVLKTGRKPSGISLIDIYYYTEKDFLIANMLQKLAKSLQAKGHDVSVVEENSASIIVCIKFKVDEREKLRNDLRRFSKREFR